MNLRAKKYEERGTRAEARTRAQRRRLESPAALLPVSMTGDREVPGVWSEKLI